MANVGYVLIEHFAVAVERRRRPELLGRPVIIGGYPHERKTVYDASAEAATAGVKPGLALRQAEQLCPTALFLPLAEARNEEAAEAFLAIIESFSPAVAPDGPGSAYFDARGLERLAMSRRLATTIHRQLGLAPRVGLGPTRFTARVVAQLSQPGTPHIVSDAPADFLSNLPVDYLSGDDAFRDRLLLLGIRTIGQFMRLPFSELMEQFGPAGVAAYHLACGDGDSPILPRPRPAALQRKQDFEPPLGDATTLARAIGHLSATLATALQRRYQSCQTVILRLELAADAASIAQTVQLEQTAQLKEPASQAGAIIAAAQRLSERMWRELETIDNSERYPAELITEPRITSLQLVATGLVAQGGCQLGLFDGQRQRRSQLQRAAVEVRRRFGDRLKRAERVPACGVATPPFVLRDYCD